jgi:hypothetical protein
LIAEITSGSLEGGRMVKEDLKEKGYSKEDEYFYKLNKELIEKKRRELDKKKAEDAKKSKSEHYMHCPKCGHEMEEIAHQGIMVDRCKGCSGIFFDRGEIEILLESREQKGFLGGLKQLFK